jgi:uncharacterized protein involved in outer membrane biogenesis/ElaB/YqjD/DUF883 family membrane-anchored ribosome-binding protein
MKKILKYSGISLLVLLTILILVPILFKSKILGIVKTEINKEINAKVEFNDLGISWFRNFPKLTLQLEELSITGIDQFENDTLLSAKNLDASVNIMSLFSGKDIRIYGIFLQSPRIYAHINKDGVANWDIVKQQSPTTSDSSSAFIMNLEKYAINKGYLVYKDEPAGIYAEIHDLDHKGSGNFQQDVFTLTTKTTATKTNFSYGNIPYIINAASTLDADIEINNSISSYGFKNAALKVNDLRLNAGGTFQFVNDSTYKIDVNFDAPSNEFKNILSLVPAIYKNDFNKIQTSGTASLKGLVKGIYSNNSLPAYNIDLLVDKASFKYPDLPKPVQNINIIANFSNPDGIYDHTIVDISKAHLEFGNEPVDLKILYKNPETLRYLDMMVKGKLNLGEITQFIKLEKGTSLAGLLDANIFAKGNLSALETHKGPFLAGGSFSVRNFSYASSDLPFPLKNGSFDVSVKNSGGFADATSIQLNKGHLEMGEDLVDLSFDLSKPMSDMIFSGRGQGRFSLDKIEKFVKLEKGTKISGMIFANLAVKGSKAAYDKAQYEKITLQGNASLKNLFYSSMDQPDGIQLQSAELVFDPAHVELKQLNGTFKKTSFSVTGELDNLLSYAMDKGILKGKVNMTADKIMLNEWMGNDTGSTSVSAPFVVPANVNVLVKANAGEVEYDKVKYRNVSGSLLVKDETIALQNVNTEALDGQINFNGSYSTRQSKKQPAIDLEYSIKKIDVQKAFLAFNTIQKLMPLGEFLSGKLSSSFKMNGRLGEDMYPELTSLSGMGDLFLLEGVLSRFQPLEKIANSLQVNALKDISLRDLETHMEFSNGRVLVKPFTLQVKDIGLTIGGTHGLDRSMDYLVALNIPRHYLGTAGNKLVNNLTAAANTKGLQVSMSDIVELNIRMTGSMKDPQMQTDLRGATSNITNELKQQATDFAKQKADSAKNQITDTLTKVKDQVIENIKTDILKQVIGNKDSNAISLDSTKKKAEERLKGTLKGILKKN